MNVPTVESEVLAEHISREKLMEDMRVLVNDAEALLKATASHTGEQVEAARARASESLHMAKARLAEARISAAARVREAARSTDHYAHEHPWQMVGIAAMAGMVIGSLISRR